MNALALEAVDVAQNTPEWERLRKRGIGGSDVPALLGVSPWVSAAELYDYKLGILARLPENDAMEWGHDLEEPILRRYARRTGFEIRRPAGILRHPEHPWVLASLDAEAYDPDLDVWIPVDAKSSLFAGTGYGDEGTDEVPLHVAAQMQWYCFVTGAPRAEIAALIGRPPVRLYTVKRDDELIERIFAIAEDFWLNNVRAGVRPEIDYVHRSTSDYLKRRYSVDDGDVIEADDEISQLVAKLKGLRAARDEAATAVDAVENRVKAFMGEHSKLVGDGFSVSWKATKGRTTVDYRAIAEELGEITEELVAKHTRTGDPYRTFRLTTR